MSGSAVASLSDLHLAVSQVQQASIPTLHISVKNTNTEVPFTVLTWNSPLDELLVQLGLASIIPPGSSAPLDIPTIMVKRRMPPSEDSLVTLEPGQEVSRTVELGERFVSPEQWKGDGSGGPAKVQLKGRWNSVWPGVRKEELLGTNKLTGNSENGALSGDFESETLEVSV
ncbi:hypothetical protein GE09DRAFT_635871 [Coniochaeta sp. 2T2.1]|nr:hypothetical protein GE09DRAFT_635871 [Coniochaeta sp. 2T2.1]